MRSLTVPRRDVTATLAGGARRPITVAVTLTALASLVAAVVPGPASADTTVVAASRDTVTVRVGTYNVNQNVAYGQARGAVRRLVEHVDVAGLQEFEAPSRVPILAELSELGWGYVKPPDGDPVIFDEDVFEVLSARGVTVAGRGRVEQRENPGKLKKVGKSVVTVVRLWHVPSGRRLVVVDFHAISKAARGGRPSRTHPRRAARYLKEIRGVADVVAQESRRGQVLLVGDWNVDYPDDARVRHVGFPIRRFGGVGLRSMWQTQRPSSGTFANGSVIDGVWAGEQPQSGTVLTGFPESDHRPVLAVYAWTATGQDAPDAPQQTPSDPAPEDEPEPEDPGLVCDLNPVCT